MSQTSSMAFKAIIPIDGNIFEISDVVRARWGGNLAETKGGIIDKEKRILKKPKPKTSK